MQRAKTSPWTFKARFRRHAFGWRSQPAITRIKEAVSEITKAARNDKVRAAEGEACETILLSSGRSEEAYRRYGLIANQAATYVAWFRAVTKKYPHKAASDVLDDLVAQTPGEEGKWFAAPELYLTVRAMWCRVLSGA